MAEPTSSALRARLEAAARTAARTLRAPYAIASVRMPDGRLVANGAGFDAPLSGPQLEAIDAFARRVLTLNGSTPDARADRRLANEPMVVSSLRARFAAAVAFDAGPAEGVLAVLAPEPRNDALAALAPLADVARLLGTADSEARFATTPDEARRTTTSRLRAIVGTSSIGIVVTDLQGIVTVWNDTAAALVGIPSRSALGQPLPMPEEARGELRRHLAAAIDGRATGGIAVSWRAHDGSAIDTDVTIAPMFDDDRPCGVMVLIADVTQRRRAEKALRDSEARYRMLLERASDAIVVWNDARTLIDANARATELLGCERHELVGSPLSQVFASEGAHAALQPTSSPLSHGRLRRRDGTTISVEVSTKRLPDGSWLAIVRDVSERLRAEEKLRRSEENFRALIEGSPDAIVVGGDRELDYANPVALRLFGYDDLADFKRNGWQTFVHPDDLADAVADTLALKAGARIPTRERRMMRKDGSFFFGEVSLLRLMFDGKLCTVAFTRDLTARKQIESKLYLNDRMASLGTLAAGVAHEINNPLAYVLMNVEYAAAEIDRATRAASSDLSEARESLREATKGAERVQQIVRDLKTFARADEETKRALDVQKVLESCVNVAWSELRHRAHVRREIEPGVAPVLGTEARLGQVFLNLIVNAAQSMQEGAAERNTLTLRARNDGPGWVVVEIADTGCGIAPSHLGRIFDPFFTTKPPGVGTGLGLSICHGLVRELGGSIGVESELDRGTLFRVRLPSVLPAPATLTPTPPAAASARRARVLVVDDEPMIGASIKRALAREHDVTVMTCAADVLAALRAGERWDVLFSDLMMPVMTGMELFDTVTAEFPEQAARMLFVTGGAFTPRALEFVEKRLDRCLHKPLRTEQLRSLVRDSLSRGG